MCLSCLSRAVPGVHREDNETSKGWNGSKDFPKSLWRKRSCQFSVCNKLLTKRESRERLASLCLWKALLTVFEDHEAVSIFPQENSP